MISENMLRVAALVVAVLFVAWPTIVSALGSLAAAIPSFSLGGGDRDEASLAVELIRRLRAGGNTEAANAAKSVLDLIVNEGASK
jgi:hypothetical protein